MQDCCTLDTARRLDIRTKLLLGFGGGVAALVLTSPSALGLLAFAATVYALRHGRPRPVIVLNLALVLFALAYFGAIEALGAVIESFRQPLAATSLSPFLRGAIVANLMLVVGLTMKFSDLREALDRWPLPPPLRVLALIAARCIPSLMKDLALIRDAVLLRRPTWSRAVLPLALVGAPRLIAMPLVVGALRTSDELAVAAELKGVELRPAPREGRRTESWRDVKTIAVAVLVLLVACGVHVADRLGGFSP
jgi:energy-coupling factor transport system permease protein